MTRRSAVDLAVGRERAAAIRACRRCDPSGWLLGPDGRAADVAVRCDQRPPAACRDVTGPLHTPSGDE